MRASMRAAALAAALVSIPALMASPESERERRRREAEQAARAVERTKQVAKWTAWLRKDDPVERFQAAWNLKALLPDSAPALLELLETRDDTGAIKVEVCGVLGEGRVRSALPALAKLAQEREAPFAARLAALIAAAKLMDGESQTWVDQVARDAAAPASLRQAAVLALGMLGAPSTGGVAEGMLASQDPMTRMAAFRAIGWSQDRRHVPRCLEGLSDPDALVASMAAKALGRLGDPATTDRLVQVSKKTPWRQQWFFILEALGRLSHGPARDELLRLVQDPKFAAQTDAATFLYEVGERRALPLFRRLLEESLRGKHQPGMDTLTAFALGAMKDAEGVPALLVALKKGRLDVRREAASSLGLIGDAKALDPLLEAVASTPDRPLRVRALIALGRLGGANAVKAVQQALRDGDPAVRWAAVVALEARKDPKQASALQPLLRDGEPFVAEAARTALALLAGTPGIAPDPRKEAVLVRLRALEREMILRLQLAGVNPQAVAPPFTPEPVADQWTDVVGYESYVSTCGGTHPPIEYRTPIYSEEFKQEQARWQELNATERARAEDQVRRRRAAIDDVYELRNQRGEGERVRERSHGGGSTEAGR